MTNQHEDDVIIMFGPRGKFSLHIPIKEVENSEITGQSFIQAGMALVLYAREQQDSQPPADLQKLFDWMLQPDEKVA